MLRSLLEQKALFLPQNANILIISWMDWQNLTKITLVQYLNNYVKNDSIFVILT